ncbi:MAG TPA: 2-C-methyl-D-erythritol 4-phosphate cytidylyltransferase [Candidatus Nanoarchaeia archaeon]|nr:2-C-methyl-D-erythritol 4-phosphate cytidylyltransferase [Candidatus Nanoarchaeia archaeon]
MNYAIIVAAGEGKRMKSRVNKILMMLDDKPVIYHSILPFNNSALIDRIILVARREDIVDINHLVKESKFSKVIIAEGGEERQDSVFNGIKAIKEAKADDIVLVHNGANPFVDDKLIEEVIDSAKQDGACAAAIRAKDTIKEVDLEGYVVKTLERKKLWQMQTPQAAQYKILVKALVKASNDEYIGTDDAELIERSGHKVKIIECSKDNFKVTTPSDLENAKLVLEADRIGFGMDSHKFSTDEKELVLGGVVIPNEEGLAANSDGDVVLHSLFNALSSACGGKSIGFYADPMCKKGMKDSSAYLQVALEMVKEKGLKINNIGIMVEGAKPKLDEFSDKIKERIAQICDIDKDKVGFCATSGEELSDFGKGKGLQVFSIVSLRREKV